MLTASKQSDALASTVRGHVSHIANGTVIAVVFLVLTLLVTLAGLQAAGVDTPQVAMGRRLDLEETANEIGNSAATIQATTSFTPVLEFAAVGDSRGDKFGIWLASAGDYDGDGSTDVIAGAFGYPRGKTIGRAYIYRGTNNGLLASASITLTGENESDRFGRAVGSAGDVNGDGYDDVVVSASEHPAGAARGKVYLFHGQEGGLNTTPAFTILGENNGDWLGWIVGKAGDVNGDGYADLLVTTANYPQGDLRGRVYVYHGGPGGVSASPEFVATGENDGDVFGWAAGTAGDINGDGYGDLVVGAYRYQSYRGKVYIYYGSASGLSTTPALVLLGENEQDRFGESLGTAGDVNKDGFDDIVIAAYNYPNYRTQGKVYIFHGGTGGISTSPTTVIVGQGDGEGFGAEVSTAGDVDADGYADVVVGSTSEKAFVFRGGKDGLTPEPAVSLSAENQGDFYGYSVATAGDIDGDGTDEVMIGSWRFPSGGDIGKLYVYKIESVAQCYSLSLSHTGSGNNPVATPTRSADCPEGQYVAGEKISVMAQADTGWTIRSWGGTDNNTSRNDTNSVSMPAKNHSVSVSYQEIVVEGGQFEPNDACNVANSIAPNGAPQTQRFHKQADTDWVRFDATAGSQYLIEVSIPAVSLADVALELYATCDSGATKGQDFSFSPGIRLQFTAPATGPIFLKLLNSDPNTAGENVTYDLSVREFGKTVSPGILILVAGSLRNDDPVQPNIYHVTDSVYQLFVDNGFTDDRIYYLAPNLDHKANGQTTSKVDALASKANLKGAIIQWAKSTIGNGKALTIYMMDHGDKELFFLDKSRQEWVDPQEIDEWLDELEAAVPDLKVNVIVEACYSGTFIDNPKTLSGPNRVIISSTDAVNLAWASDKGAQFSDHFINAMARGQSLFASFQEAKTASATANPSQLAWIDGDGNSEPLGSGDQVAAAQRGFTFAGTFPVGIDSWPPYIVDVEQPITIEDGRGLLQATVRDDIAVDQVYAVVYSPSYKAPEASEALVQEPLPTVTLLDQGKDVYAAYYDGFRERGAYRIVFYARDGQLRPARPVSIRVNTGAELYLPTVLLQR